ncbi:MAG TPA: site-specific DNA-methyltransferase [Nitrososphaeraceae archaeon]|jgi:adenine-specific DNA-methyltransferase
MKNAGRKERISTKIEKWPEHEDGSTRSNFLIHADNLVAIKYMLRNGFREKIDLIYIDPPFFSGSRYYHRKGIQSDLAFQDIWSNQVISYMKMIRPRLRLMKDLISSKGSIFVHLDWHIAHYVKVTMDRIFGIENFRNEIIVKRGRKKNLQYQFEEVDRMHTSNDIILWYSKCAASKYSKPLVKANLDSKWMSFWSNTDRPTMRYKIFASVPERGQWKWAKERAKKAIHNYDIFVKDYEKKYTLEKHWQLTNKSLEFIRKRSNVKYPEYWIPPKTSRIIDNMWLDIESYNYSTGYGTEKHSSLLERIINLFSDPNAIVSDLFCGSGTTLLVAEKMGRHWIGCDSSEVAIKVVKERMGTAKYEFLDL